MNREQRIFDNWALFCAITLAKQRERIVEIVFNLDPEFLGGTLRQLDFKCKSLAVVDEQARALGIPFTVLV